MNENILYTTQAICNSHKLNQESINDMVEWGIACPLGNGPEKWLFSHDDYERIGRAQRFRNELDINIPGAALAIELIEELEQLRNKEYKLCFPIEKP